MIIPGSSLLNTVQLNLFIRMNEKSFKIISILKTTNEADLSFIERTYL